MHSFVSVVHILLFLLFLFLPANDKLERNSFIDPTDCKNSRKGNNKFPYRGDLQRNVNLLNSLEDGAPPPDLLMGARGAPTSGNPQHTIHTDDDSNNNVPELDCEDTTADYNGQPTLPGVLPAGVMTVNPLESLPDIAEIVVGTWNIQSDRNCQYVYIRVRLLRHPQEASDLCR